jgi:hypothetical protein
MNEPTDYKSLGFVNGWGPNPPVEYTECMKHPWSGPGSHDRDSYSHPRGYRNWDCCHDCKIIWYSDSSD